MGWARSYGGSTCRRRTAALGLVWLAAALATQDAQARRPWCDDLPASLERSLTDVGCGAGTEYTLGEPWRPTSRAPERLAPLHRLPTWQHASAPLALPPVSLPPQRGPALAERSFGALLLRMGLFASISTALVLAAEPPRTPRWTSTPGFDDDARDALRASSRGGRKAASLSSDILLATAGATLLADWYMQRDVYPALKSVAADGGWLLLNEIATSSAKAGAGRQRPYAVPCTLDPSYVKSCNAGRDDNASFYSGHASWSATLAGLVCARRQAFERTDATGIRWGDVAWCGFAVSVSVATGLLRIAADRHHLSDVGAGWTSGFLTGFVLPRAVDYRAAGGKPFSRFRLAPLRREGAWGLEYSFQF